MTRYRRGVATAAAVVLAALVGVPAQAQVKPASGDGSDVRRLEIWNGSTRTVHYFGNGISPGEEASLRELARAENDLATADEVQNLRRLYLSNERFFEQRRSVVNQQLYGYSSSYTADQFSGPFYGYAGGFGYPYYGLGGFGRYYGAWAYPGMSASQGTVTNSLDNGISNEGVLKNEFARVLAESAKPEAATQAARAYDIAAARVGESDRLRTALGWGKGGVIPVREERWVGGPMTVTTKDGKSFEGTLVREDAEWVTVETKTEEVTLRKAEVTRVVRPKKDTKPDNP